MGRWLVIAMVACGCGGGGAGAADAGSDGPPPCGRGDDCNVPGNTGCDDDDRCAVVQNGTCYMPVCEPFGSLLAGDACTLSNNDGAEYWDDCGPTMVCYKGVCTQACTLSVSDAGCPMPATCAPDSEVGTLALGVCVAP